MSKFKKLIISSLLALQLLALPSTIVSTTMAQEPPQQEGAPLSNETTSGGTETWYDPSLNGFILKVFGDNPSEIFGERYTFAQVKWIIHSLAIIGMGDISKCLTIKEDSTQFSNCVNSLIPSEGGANVTEARDLGPVIGMAAIAKNIYSTKPTSGINYVASTMSRLNIIPETYAQTGFGFNTFQPILPLWQMVRNISFALLTIAFITTAFLVMFRVKISPQAVASIQSMIPKLAFVLIGISFSYAIAGFMVDLSYVANGVIAFGIKSAGSSLSDMSMAPLFTELSSGNGIFSIFVGLVIMGVVFFVLGGALVGSFAGLTGAIGGGVAVIISVLIFIVFLVIALVFLFRFIWVTLRTLVNIIMLLIAGPIVILTGIFPGGPGFSSWIRSLIANIAVYPTISLLTFVAHFFFFQLVVGPMNLGVLDFLNTYSITYTNAAPAYIGIPVAGGYSNIIGFFLALMTIGLIPHASNLVRSLIDRKPFDARAAIGLYGTGYSTGMWPINWYQQAVTQQAQREVGQASVSHGSVTSLVGRVMGKKDSG